MNNEIDDFIRRMKEGDSSSFDMDAKGRAVHIIAEAIQHMRHEGLALLWQICFMRRADIDLFSAVWTSPKWLHDPGDDGVADGWQAWLGRGPVDSFFPASPRGDDAGGKHRRSLS